MSAARELFTGKLVLGPITMGGNLPFRRLCRELGADVTFGEMAVALKVVQRRRGELVLLRTHECDHPFGAQLAARDADSLVPAALRAAELGADFVDLNCGCPIDQIVRRGLGARLLQKPRRLGELVGALKRALAIPVTVKIRSGWSARQRNFLEVARIAQEEGADAVTLHARTREQRYSKAADWDAVAELKENLSIPVIGNGDLLAYWEIEERRRRSGCDAVMMARGALIKPWIFREAQEGRSIHLTAPERLDLLRRYVQLALEHFGDDEFGRRRVRTFLLWHLDFFCRYRHLPEETYRSAEFSHPLLQTRFDSVTEGNDLESLLRRTDRAAHEHVAAIVLDGVDPDTPPPHPVENEAVPRQMPAAKG